MAATATAQKPRPQPPRDNPLSVQIVTRLSEPSRETIRALAAAEGLTIQQLGAYAWSLALQAYGKPPLPEAGA
jgi:hypothetical protein